MKPFLDFLGELLTFRRDLAQTRTEIKELSARVDDLTDVVKELAFELRATRQHEDHEREKFELRLENVLLRAGRQLPPRQDEQP